MRTANTQKLEQPKRIQTKELTPTSTEFGTIEKELKKKVMSKEQFRWVEWEGTKIEKEICGESNSIDNKKEKRQREWEKWERFFWDFLGNNLKTIST